MAEERGARCIWLDFVKIGRQIGVGCVDGNPKRNRRATDQRCFVGKWSSVIDQTVIADAKGICLVEARSFLFRLIWSSRRGLFYRSSEERASHLARIVPNRSAS